MHSRPAVSNYLALPRFFMAEVSVKSKCTFRLMSRWTLYGPVMNTNAVKQKLNFQLDQNASQLHSLHFLCSLTAWIPCRTNSAGCAMSQPLDSTLEPSLARAANPSLDAHATTSPSYRSARTTIDVSSTRRTGLPAKPAASENVSWLACQNQDLATAGGPTGSRSTV